MPELVQRLVKFGLAGAATTALAYVIFIPLVGVMRPAAAVACAWVVCVLVGYALNRRFTFRSRNPAGRELPLFVTGSLLQLAVAAAGIELLIGWGLAPTPAFLVNTVATTAVSFAFQSLVTFRGAPRRP